MGPAVFSHAEDGPTLADGESDWKMSPGRHFVPAARKMGVLNRALSTVGPSATVLPGARGRKVSRHRASGANCILPLRVVGFPMRPRCLFVRGSELNRVVFFFRRRVGLIDSGLD